MACARLAKLGLAPRRQSLHRWSGGNRTAKLPEHFQMSLDRFPDVALCIFQRLARRDATRQIGNIRSPVGLGRFEDDRVFYFRRISSILTGRLIFREPEPAPHARLVRC